MPKQLHISEWINSLALALVISGIALALYSSWAPLRVLDEYLYASRLPTGSLAHPELVLVQITDSTLDRYGTPPWDRQILHRALSKISAYPNAVVGLDMFLEDSMGEPGDTQLATLTGERHNIVIARRLAPEDTGRTGFYDQLAKARPNYGIALFQEEKGYPFTGFATFELSYRVGNSEFNSFIGQVFCAWRDLALTPDECRRYIAREIGWASAHPTNPALSDGIPINFISAESPYPVVLFEDIADGTSDFDFSNKIALIGAATDRLNDSFFTPLSVHSGRQTYGVVVWANALNTLMTGELIMVPPIAVTYSVVFVLSLAVLRLNVMNRRPVLSRSLFLFVCTAISSVMFQAARTQVVVMPLALAMLFCLAVKRLRISAGSQGPVGEQESKRRT